MAKAMDGHSGRFGIRALATGLIVVACGALIAGLVSRQPRDTRRAGKTSTAVQVEGGI